MPLSTLRYGERGDEVKALQIALNYHLPNAMPPLKTDSIFGPKTQDRLMTFQKRHGLTVDGVAGPKTLPALYSFVEATHNIMPVAHAPVPDMRAILRGIGADAGRTATGGFLLAPRSRFGGSSGRIGDARDTPPSLGLILPLPRLQVPLLKGVALPPYIQLPLLKLDPDLMKWLRLRPFEIQAGTNMAFRKQDPGVDAFVEVSATLWSAPLFKDKLKLSTAAGVAGEARVTDGHFSYSVFYAAKAELHDVLTYNGVDILKMEAEGRLQATPGSREPPNLSTTLTIGPSVETKNRRFEFGFGGYLQYQFDGQQHVLSGGPSIKGTWKF